jgi:hypothetical protein
LSFEVKEQQTLRHILVVFLLWRIHTSENQLKVIPLAEESRAKVFMADSNQASNVIKDSTGE